MTQEDTKASAIAHQNTTGTLPLPHRPINIADGFTVDDVKTVEHCDQATALLLIGRKKIDEQIEDFFGGDLGPTGTRDAAWLRRARSSHLLKGIALQQVQNKRRAFAEAERRQNAATTDRAIIAIVREIAPEIAARAIDLAQQRGLVL